MRPMKLHWSPTSPYVRKVMVAAHELGLGDAFDRVATTPERVVVDVAPDNPLGQVPTLILPDGTALFDSLVIVEYLNERAGGALIPSSGPARWAVLTRHALAQGLIDAAIRRVAERRRPAGEISPAFLEAKRAECARVLAAFERKPPAPGQVDVAAIALAAGLGYLDFRFPDEAWRPAHPALARWYADFARRPSMTATAPPR